jgi:hypothetical protein
MRLLWRMCLLLAGLVVLGTTTAPIAWAAGVVGDGTPASCDGNAVQAALNGGGIVTFNCGANPHTINANTYVIQADTTVLGGDSITLNGENLRQIFIVNDGVTLNLQDITLLDGEFSSGGCIYVFPTATLTTQNVTFRSCRDTSTTLGGGAVHNLGIFTAVGTRFENNQAVNDGGAVFNRGRFTTYFATFDSNQAADNSGAIDNDENGVVEINDSIFTNNQATDLGGAVTNLLSFPTTTGSFLIRRSLFINNSAGTLGGAVNNGIGSMTIENSTFTGNSANQGGGVFSDGNANTIIRASTFVDNRANTAGALYRNLSSTVTLSQSILAGSRDLANTSDQLECDGPAVTSGGHNIIEDGSCVNGSDATDLRNTAPQLGPLQDNGGFSMTFMPDATSPALDKIESAQCLSPDQRRADRLGDFCDIGAVERGGLFASSFLPLLSK